MLVKWLKELRTRLFGAPGPQVSGVRGFLLRVVRLVYFSWSEFRRTLGFERSASLTFATILSLIPVSVLFLSFVSKLGLAKKIETYIEENIFPYIAPTPEIREPLQGLMEKASKQLAFGEGDSVNVVGLVALISLVNAALGVILTAERNFNRIWQTRSTRSYLQKFAVFWVILTISPFVLLASTQVGEILMPPGSMMNRLADNYAIIRWLYGFVVPAFLGLVGFTVLYVFLPSSKVNLLSALVGALAASILWEVSRRSFGFYVERSKNLYGQLATIPLGLVWIYTNWVIALFGCVMAYVHQNFRVFNEIGHRLERVSPVPVAFVGVFLLEQVARAFRGGRPFPSAESVGRDLGVSPDRVEEAAAFLVPGGFLAETTEPEGYALCRAPEDVTLRSVVEALPQEDFPDELEPRGDKSSRRARQANLGTGALKAFQSARRSYLASFGEWTLADVVTAHPTPERADVQPSADGAAPP